MTDESVLYERRGGVGLITLNRPRERNCMSNALLEAFDGAIDLALRDDPRALVVTGSGSCFSAGADLKGGLQRGEPGASPQERSYAMYEPFLRVLDLPMPVIGALNGHAVGGGFGLALLADLRVATTDSLYGANFARLGIAAGLGITYVLPRLIGAERAAELLFTGRLVDGKQAETLGLCAYALPGEDVLDKAVEIASEIASTAPLAVRAIKGSLRRSLGWEVRQAAFQEAGEQAETLATDDAREGIAALLEKRPPRFEGR